MVFRIVASFYTTVSIELNIDLARNDYSLFHYYFIKPVRNGIASFHHVGKSDIGAVFEDRL